jgi:hypothetical protein
MLHAREDYQRFQDPECKIGADEPVMLFRAQDKHFYAVLANYRDLLAADPDAKPDIRKAVLEHMRRALVWQREHGCKTPDLPA